MTAAGFVQRIEAVWTRELDVYIDGDEKVVTGLPIQTAIVPILGEWARGQS